MSGVALDDLAANLLLASLDLEDQQNLAGRLSRRHFAMGDLLYGAGDRLREVCFPTSGVISLVAGTDRGEFVEVATVGSEGMVGVPLILGRSEAGNVMAVCQMPSDSLLVPAEQFAAWMDTHDRRLPAVLAAYLQLQLIEAAQSVVCNRLHALDQRCARWLLLSHDRARADEFPITHELLAQMLGVRRASVTLTVRRLQTLGLIATRRGSVRIEDRAGLEATSCECYAAVRYAQEELLPAPAAWLQRQHRPELRDPDRRRLP